MLGEYATARWPDVFRETRRAQDEVNRLLAGLRLSQSADFPPVNIWAGGEGATVMAQVPGVNPDELDITVHQDTLTLSGKRVTTGGAAAHEACAKLRRPSGELTAVKAADVGFAASSARGRDLMPGRER